MFSVPKNRKLAIDCSAIVKKRLDDLVRLKLEPKRVRNKNNGNVKLFQFQFSDGSTVSKCALDVFPPPKIWIRTVALFSFNVRTTQVTLGYRNFSENDPVVVIEVIIAGNQCTKDADAKTISKYELIATALHLFTYFH